MPNFNTIQVVNAGRSRTIGTTTDNLALARNLIIPNGVGLESEALSTSDDILVKLADNGGLSTVQIQDSDNAVVTSIDSDGNMDISGNLSVTGNIISRDEERVLVADNFLDVNFGYVATTFESGGIAVNYQTTGAGTNLSINTATNTLTFSAVSGEDEPKVVASTASGIPADTYSADDIIQISGTPNAENDGFYVVFTNAVAGTIEFKSTATTTPDSINFKPAQVNVTSEAQSSGTVTISKVKVTTLQVKSDGTWETATGDSDTDFASPGDLGGSSLQEAYALGNTIAMTDADGNFDVSVGSGTPAISLDAAANSNFTVAGGSLTLSTTTSGAISVSSAGTAAFASASGSAATFGDGVFTLSSTSGAVTETGLTDLTLSGSGTVTITGDTASKFGDDVGTVDFDGSGAITDTGVVSYGLTPSAAFSVSGGTTTGISGSGDMTLDSTAGAIAIGSNTTTGVDINAATGTSVIDLKVAGSSKFAVNGTASTLDSQYSLAFGTLGTATAPTSGASVQFTNNTGSALVKGTVVALNASGELVAADCDGAGTANFPIGAVANEIADGAAGPVAVFGMMAVISASGACPASDRGKPVYLTDLATGSVSTTPPSTAGDTVFQVGILQAADTDVGALRLAYILFQPQFIADLA